MAMLKLRLFLLTLVTVLAFSGNAGAEVPANCTLSALDDPERYELACSGALTIELEPGAILKYSGEAGGLPERLILEKGRALIEVTPGSSVPQIRTPHAIAAVRGTTYALEVDSGTTSVFVQQGTVEVRSRQGAVSSATLTAGQGVDVIPGQSFSAVTWGASRVRDLLARFGR